MRGKERERDSIKKKRKKNLANPKNKEGSKKKTLLYLLLSLCESLIFVLLVLFFNE